MGDKKVVILGDSHTDAIKRACKLLANRSENISVYRYSRKKNGGMIGDMSEGELLSMVELLNDSDIVVSVVGGNLHQTFSLVQHPEAFDFFVPNVEQELLARTKMIPFHQVSSLFASRLASSDVSRISKISDNAPCRVFHLLPPPPKKDEQHILRKQEATFAKAGILSKGVSPAALRLKCWDLQISLLKEAVRSLPVSLLSCPEGTQTSEGFLKPAYYANDATHANVAYGELVLQQIEEILL